MKILKKVKNIIMTIILIIVGYAVLGNISALNSPLYNIVHYRNYVVLTGSMEPDISPGDYITVLKVNLDKLKEGDVVTYSREGTSVTHKIVSIDGDTVITQGTANNIADEPITKSDIIGKYLFKIPSVGYAMQFFSSLSGMILIFGFIGIAIFWEMTDPARKKKAVKEEIKKGSTGEEVIREVIFDNLTELGRLSKDDVELIEGEKDIDTLKEWSRESAKVFSVDEFFKNIKGGVQKTETEETEIAEETEQTEENKWNVSKSNRRNEEYTCTKRSKTKREKSKH